MKNDELTKQQIDAVLQALNDALDEGPWDESNFLRAIGKNLREIRDGFVQQMSLSEQALSLQSKSLVHQRALRGDQQKIYIALYSTDGANMQSWERILANLPTQIISRPVYAEENDVIEMIKMKDKKINEAYVVVYISKQDILILPPDKRPVDKLGKEMLTLKDKTISVENIDCFVYQAINYRFWQGRLIKSKSIDSA